MPVPRLFEASSDPREQWVHVLATLLGLGGPETRTTLVEEISGEALPEADALLVREQRPLTDDLLGDIVVRGAGWTFAVQATLAFDDDEEERLRATHDALAESYDKVIVVAVTPDRTPPTAAFTAATVVAPAGGPRERPRASGRDRSRSTRAARSPSWPPMPCRASRRGDAAPCACRSSPGRPRFASCSSTPRATGRPPSRPTSSPRRWRPPATITPSPALGTHRAVATPLPAGGTITISGTTDAAFAGFEGRLAFASTSVSDTVHVAIGAGGAFSVTWTPPHPGLYRLELAVPVARTADGVTLRLQTLRGWVRGEPTRAPRRPGARLHRRHPLPHPARLPRRADPAPRRPGRARRRRRRSAGGRHPPRGAGRSRSLHGRAPPRRDDLTRRVAADDGMRHTRRDPERGGRR